MGLSDSKTQNALVVWCRNSWTGCKKIMFLSSETINVEGLHVRQTFTDVCVCVFLLHERDFFHSLGVITKPFNVRSSEVV